MTTLVQILKNKADAKNNSIEKTFDPKTDVYYPVLVKKLEQCADAGHYEYYITFYDLYDIREVHNSRQYAIVQKGIIERLVADGFIIETQSDGSVFIHWKEVS